MINFKSSIVYIPCKHKKISNRRNSYAGQEFKLQLKKVRSYTNITKMEKFLIRLNYEKIPDENNKIYLKINEKKLTPMILEWKKNKEKLFQKK